jgi:hypothetical protein
MRLKSENFNSKIILQNVSYFQNFITYEIVKYNKTFCFFFFMKPLLVEKCIYWSD